MQSDNKTMLRPNEETIYDIKGFKRHKSLPSIIYLKEFIFISINHHEKTHLTFFEQNFKNKKERTHKLSCFWRSEKFVFNSNNFLSFIYFYFVCRVETLVEKFLFVVVVVFSFLLCLTEVWESFCGLKIFFFSLLFIHSSK